MVPVENIFEDTTGSEDNLEDVDAVDEYESPSTSDRECVVCKDNMPNIVLMPCKHLKICDICHLKFKKNSGPYICPYCREIMQDSIQVFV